jgi:hypothetical protein
MSKAAGKSSVLDIQNLYVTLPSSPGVIRKSRERADDMVSLQVNKG